MSTSMFGINFNNMLPVSPPPFHLIVSHLPRGNSPGCLSWPGSLIRPNVFSKVKSTSAPSTLSSIQGDTGHLSQVKDLVQHDKCGVYSLSCGQCTATYTGQTDRSIGECLKEHFLAHRNNVPRYSAFARHLLEAGHQLQRIHIQLLQLVSKGRLLNKLEEVAAVETLTDCNTALVNNVQLSIFNNSNFIYKDMRTLITLLTCPSNLDYSF